MNVNAVMNDLDEQKRQNRDLRNELSNRDIRIEGFKKLLDEQAAQMKVMNVDLKFAQAAHADCEETIDSQEERVAYLEKGLHWLLRVEYMGYSEMRMAIDEIIAGTKELRE
jgi:chromosome segregation ATPase